jgi:hypothetical protein
MYSTLFLKSITKIFLGFGLLFFSVLTQSCTVNKLHCGILSESRLRESTDDMRNYLVKNDGTKIYGEKIWWNYGILAGKTIFIDKQRFSISEIKTYRMDEVTFVRYGHKYLERRVHGKLNAYISDRYRSPDRLGCFHYIQQGDDGKIVPLPNTKVLLKAVEDCPKAFQMVNISMKKLNKALNKNSKYIIEVFNIYNKGCQ